MSAKGNLVDRFGNPLTSVATVGYQPSYYTRFCVQPRDLPIFSFRVIRYMQLDQTIVLGLAMRSAAVANSQIAYQVGQDWTPGVNAKNPDVKAWVERTISRFRTLDLANMLKAQVWGWAAGEIVWEVEDGLLEYQEIIAREPRDCVPLERDGRLSGVRFMSSSHSGSAHIDCAVPGKAMWHGYNDEASRYHGMSVLRGSYSAFADKWFDGGALDVRRLYMHSDAYAGMRIFCPPGAIDIDGVGTVPCRDVARQMAEQYKSGNVMVCPSVYDSRGNLLWRIEDAKPSQTPVHILQYPKDLDVEMLRGLEIPDDVLTSESSGAWQGKQVPMQAFYSGLNVWASRLWRDFKRCVLDYGVEQNFGKGQKYEVSVKPLDLQAMESQKPPQQGGGPSGGPPPSIGGPPGQPPSPPSASGVQAMGLDEAIGRGVISADDVLEAIRCRVRGKNQRMSTGPEIVPSLFGSEPVGIGCAMFLLPGELASRVWEFCVACINPEDVTGKGFEASPHVTIKYGIRGCDQSAIQNAVSGEGAVAVSFGGLGVFENDDCDVLYVEVKSDGLVKLNKRFTELCDCEPSTHPGYTPHVTVAHIKKGEGRKYVGAASPLTGDTCVFRDVVYSVDRSMVGISPLIGKVAFSIDSSISRSIIDPGRYQDAVRSIASRLGISLCDADIVSIGGCARSHAMSDSEVESMLEMVREGASK